MEENSEYDIKTYYLFIDFKTAYDSVGCQCTRDTH
jgi:hypothetical protein